MTKISCKPEITKRKVKTKTKVVEGHINSFMYKQGGYKKHRVDGGWKYYTGITWEFVPDEVVTKKKVIDKGGYLDLSNREVSSLDDVTKWFSNNELDTIKRLNLSNNSIKNFDNLTMFRKVKEVNLDGNNISEILDIDSLKHIRNIVVTNNPIAEQKSKLPTNFTYEIITPCSKCNSVRGRYELDIHKNLCKSCYKKQKKKIDKKYISQSIRNDKHLQRIYEGPPKNGCMVALLLVISLGLSILFI